MKKILFPLLICLFFTQTVIAQIDSTDFESMDELLISASRSPETRKAISRQIEKLSSKNIAQLQAANLADAIQLSGHAFVQKSQLGGGSIVLRGFESSRILYVIDGVRLNNATYRAGHLQDLISIDQFMVDKIELLMGGGSSMYGSDALGGVVYVKTLNPYFTDSLTIKPFAVLRTSSAGNNVSLNTGLKVANKNWSTLFNATISSYGDLKMGSKDFSTVPNFGYRKKYVNVRFDKDTILTNKKPRVQIGTAYNQYDIVSKTAFKSKNWIHTLFFNSSWAPTVPRYDRLTFDSIPNFAEWEYTPQNRLLAYYNIQKTTNKTTNNLTAAIQRTKLGRLTRNFNDLNRRTQTDRVAMLTLNWDFTYKYSKQTNFAFGAESVFNDVKSTAANQNIDPDAPKIQGNTRYADSLAQTYSASLYAGINGKISTLPFYYTLTARLTTYALNAKFTKRAQAFLPNTKIQFNHFAPSAELGLTYTIIKNINVKGSASTAFRNPNIDDMTKLFESRRGTKVLVPNNNIKQERTYNGEFSIQYEAKDFGMEGGAYYTQVQDLLIEQGQKDSLIFNGTLSRVFKLQNAANGFIKGAFLGARFKILPALILSGSITFTQGKYKIDSTGFLPLDHIPPTFGRVALQYKKQNYQVQLYCMFNTTKPASQYGNSGEDNAEDAPNGFTPAWQTYHLAASTTVSKNVELWANFDNLLNLNYRPFASGINAAGFNASFTVKVAF